MAARPNVFTVPSGAPFLQSLVAALLGGELVEGIARNDPFALADVTIFLPTRRAARALRHAFLAELGRPLLLPRIRTLGDLDEDEGDLRDSPELPPSASTLHRQLALSTLVMAWSGAMARAVADLPDEELVVPASPADAFRLAGSLGRLIDQVGTAREAWTGLFAGIPAELAQYWEITLGFLKIATQFWPAQLEEAGLLDPGVRRDMAIRGEAARLRSEGAAAPVIAAGSTGSVPATAALLAAIAALPNGAVVLPGLDQRLDDESWDEVGPSAREPAGAGHPQYGLKRLLAELGVRRADVVSIGVAPTPLETRARFVSEALRPAGTTERWSEQTALADTQKRSALAGVGIVHAGNEREEAMAVALILRASAERAGEVAALVTPDRGLARRVAVELKRWGIDVDDSAGRPLATSAPGVLARLVADVALGHGAPEALLAFLKHPLSDFGLEPAAARRAGRALERAILRGPRLEPGLAALRTALARKNEMRQAEDGWRVLGAAAKHLSESEWTAAEDLTQRLQASLAPLEQFGRAQGSAPLRSLVAAHAAALASVSQSGELGAHEAGEALAATMANLEQSASFGPDLRPTDYPAFFAAAMEGETVRRRGGLDPRIHIWGALEARLQQVDTIVLGGVNEGTWPSQTRLDPLLSRPMRAALRLEPPERRIGLAAHDFAQALGQPTVWITRADRETNEPRVASRWLQRLTAYAGADLAAEMSARGAQFVRWAKRLDVGERPDPARRPRPSPPVETRPDKLSATQIETLIRDPYAIYARHVLHLNPLEPLAKSPDAAERGTLIHDILERFVRERPSGPFDAEAEARLLAIGREAFAAYSDFPEIGTLWWPRFERIARWFVREEAQRADIVVRRVEGRGVLQVTPHFRLTARADRLDSLDGGSIGIVDYKTGAPPSNDEVLSLSPQLPLEALIVAGGGFDGIADGTKVSRLDYYHISGRGEGGTVCPRGERAKAAGGKQPVTLDEAIAMTGERLHDLVADFARPEAQYLSRKIPRRGRDYAGDYDHLARVAEWSVAEESEAEAP